MRFLITILLLTATCFAKAQSPEMQKEIETSLELMDIHQTTLESIKPAIEQIKAICKISDTDAMCKEIADETSIFYRKVITNLLTEKYTLDELKKINSFMATPEGKKFTRHFTLTGPSYTSETYNKDGDKTVSPEMQAEIEKAIRLMDIPNLAKKQYDMAKDTNTEDLDAETIASINEMLDAMAKAASDIHINIATNNLKNNYTIDELKKINNFLESEDGKLFTSLQTSYISAAHKIITENPEIMEKIEKLVTKYMQK